MTVKIVFADLSHTKGGEIVRLQMNVDKELI